jgi:hypothetical protein
VHFRLKARRKDEKGSQPEKRGGKGGADWPPMNELKLWMEEVNVTVDPLPGGLDFLADWDETDGIGQVEPGLSTSEQGLELDYGEGGETMEWDPNIRLCQAPGLLAGNVVEMDVADFLLMRESRDFHTSPIGIPPSNLGSPSDAMMHHAEER